jgi:hypothetical protein
MSWDFTHHYSSVRKSILNFFLDWPNFEMGKIAPLSPDEFTFKPEDETHYEDEYWRLDFMHIIKLIFGPEVTQHPVI